MLLACDDCGTAFTPVKSWQRFCSQRCARRARSATVRACVWCGDPLPSGGSRRYCSTECRYEATDRVANDTLREAFERWRERRELSQPEALAIVANRAGITRRKSHAHRGPSKHCPDTTQLGRYLGLLLDGQGYRRAALPHDVAVRIVDALGLDPVDVNI